MGKVQIRSTDKVDGQGHLLETIAVQITFRIAEREDVGRRACGAGGHHAMSS